MIRRTDDRRRRVLLSSGGPSAESNSSQAVQAGWRSARRPTVPYGSKVRQSLRGRWFSLVPVSNVAMAKVVALLFALALGITLLHHLTMTAEGIKSRLPLFGLLHIDAPGSIGRFLISSLWLLLAGVATLIYQLRCYRNDDFSGRYQMWRIVMASCLIASAATSTTLVAGLGSGLEWILGERVALSGSDWIGLLITLAAFVLAVRTVAELWGQHLPAICNFLGWCLLAFPVIDHWNLWQIADRPWRQTAMTSAPLWAVVLWLIGATQYLRILFAEVRGAEHEPSWLSRLISAARESTSFAGRRQLDPVDAPEKPRKVAKPKIVAATKPISEPKPTPKPSTVVAPEVPPQPVSPPIANAAKDKGTETPESSPAKPRRSWWPGRQKVTPESADPIELNSAKKANPVQPSLEASDEPPKRGFRFRLPGFGGRKKTNPADDDSIVAPGEKAKAPSTVHQRPASPAPRAVESTQNTDDDDLDDENDDSGMSKAERRRQRKLMRRGKAA